MAFAAIFFRRLPSALDVQRRPYIISRTVTSRRDLAPPSLKLDRHADRCKLGSYFSDKRGNHHAESWFRRDVGCEVSLIMLSRN